MRGHDEVGGNINPVCTKPGSGIINVNYTVQCTLQQQATLRTFNQRVEHQGVSIIYCPGNKHANIALWISLWTPSPIRLQRPLRRRGMHRHCREG